MPADYDWHPTSNKGGGSVFKVETRNLGWWVLLAVIVSIILHILLYILLNRWERTVKEIGPVNFRVQTKQETIDRSELEKLLAQEPELSDHGQAGTGKCERYQCGENRRI